MVDLWEVCCERHKIPGDKIGARRCPDIDFSWSRFSRRETNPNKKNFSAERDLRNMICVFFSIQLREEFAFREKASWHHFKQKNTSLNSVCRSYFYHIFFSAKRLFGEQQIFHSDRPADASSNLMDLMEKLNQLHGFGKPNKDETTGIWDGWKRNN